MIKKILFAVGMVLILINITGLFKSLRNPAIYTDETTPYINDITLTYDEMKKEAERKEGEGDHSFILRVNSLVNKGTAYYMKREGIRKYNLRVPAWENYILYAASLVDPEKYARYEFRNYRKNMERGVGLCSTHSIIAKGILNDNGIEAELVDLAGHVVVRAQVSPGKWYIIDPTIGGIVIPHDLPDIEADPDIIRPYYEDRLHLYREIPSHFDSNNDLVKYYGKEGNHVYTMDNSFENFTYAAIWILPLLLMFPFLLSTTRRCKNGRDKTKRQQ